MSLLHRIPLRRARRRAERRGLRDRIEFHHCSRDSLGLTRTADFVLAFWMFHEVSQPRTFLSEIRSILRTDGHLLIAEPKIHVPAAFFARSVVKMREAGYTVRDGPPVRLSRSVLCSPN